MSMVLPAPLVTFPAQHPLPDCSWIAIQKLLVLSTIFLRALLPDARRILLILSPWPCPSLSVPKMAPAPPMRNRAQSSN